MSDPVPPWDQARTIAAALVHGGFPVADVAAIIATDSLYPMTCEELARLLIDPAIGAGLDDVGLGNALKLAGYSAADVAATMAALGRAPAGSDIPP